MNRPNGAFAPNQVAAYSGCVEPAGALAQEAQIYWSAGSPTTSPSNSRTILCA